MILSHTPSRSPRHQLQESRRIVAVSAGVLLVCFGSSSRPIAADTKSSSSPAQSMEAKILALSTPAAQPSESYQPIVITESEANAYLKEHGPEFMPSGISNVELHIQPDKVLGAAEVDFDELNRDTKNSNDVGAQLVAWVFKGKQRLAVTGKLSTENRQGKLSIENVTVGSTALPDWLVQWVLDNYLQKRYNIDLSKPFPLPDHVTNIELASGQATFMRSPKKAAAPNAP